MRVRPLFTLSLAGMLLFPSIGVAQQSAAGAQPAVQPGVIVVSYNKCSMRAPAQLDSLNALAFFPVLDELINERRLLGWGVLGHAWGDEWNYVIYYTAENVAAFHSAFNEAVRRVGQRRPDVWDAFATLCTEHKDNIYSVRRLGVQPPAP
ncbi:MAG TPA: hypothetical protein VMM77_10435 [Gemmatimonadaceae bacterium]|nr:hypothetical protein [Gemmatimonadaceae bacterium]